MSVDLKEKVIDELKMLYDPEIPVNIYDLGLIYDVAADDASGEVDVKFTLTSPHCPAVESLPAEMEERIRALPGVTDVKLNLVWDPPFHPSMMSEAARLELGFF